MFSMTFQSLMSLEKLWCDILSGTTQKKTLLSSFAFQWIVFQKHEICDRIF